MSFHELQDERTPSSACPAGPGPRGGLASCFVRSVTVLFWEPGTTLRPRPHRASILIEDEQRDRQQARGDRQANGERGARSELPPMIALTTPARTPSTTASTPGVVTNSHAPSIRPPKKDGWRALAPVPFFATIASSRARVAHFAERLLPKSERLSAVASLVARGTNRPSYPLLVWVSRGHEAQVSPIGWETRDVVAHSVRSG